MFLVFAGYIGEIQLEKVNNEQWVISCDNVYLVAGPAKKKVCLQQLRLFLICFKFGFFPIIQTPVKFYRFVFPGYIKFIAKLTEKRDDS